uniref:putative malate dehydrogenase 1B n=1 Tax=Styela clava TaxID=7725 RepID=UPI00193945DA|nr:putative malate dehydrogenase 1B [Styela clava]
MAKFVIAGSCNCPYYAKLELLADELCINLPQFKVHKIVKPVEEWSDWLRDLCIKNKWSHVKSPIVWRELVDRGGKGSLIGGFNEFLEYAQCYYGVTSNIMTDLMLKMREENERMSDEKKKEEEYYKSLSKPINICITNASCPSAYHLVPAIASGEVFGSEVEISLRLLDSEDNMNILKGLELESFDLAYPLLRQTTLTSDPEQALKNTTAVFILDEVSMENEKGQIDSKTDWLKRNAKLFEKYAEILNNHALADVKVIVSGSGPVNFNTHVLTENATNISKQNIVAASRLQERRMRASLANKLKTNSVGVKDAIVWGDCANDGAERIFADISLARTHNYDGAVWGPDWFSRPVIEMVYDNKWLSTDFISDLQKHETTLKEQLHHDGSVSAASALSSLMHDWFLGSKGDEMFSLGVESEGWYGVKNCVFSLPVKFTTPGSYQVVWDLKPDDETMKKITELENEVKKDIRLVFPEEEPALVEEKVFGENVEVTAESITTDSLTKTPGGDKLEIIKEENEATNGTEGKDSAEKESEEKPEDTAEPTEEEAELDPDMDDIEETPE